MVKRELCIVYIYILAINAGQPGMDGRGERRKIFYFVLHFQVQT